MTRRKHKRPHPWHGRKQTRAEEIEQLRELLEGVPDDIDSDDMIPEKDALDDRRPRQWLEAGCSRILRCG